MRTSAPFRAICRLLLLVPGVLAASCADAGAQILVPQFPSLSNPGAPHAVVRGDFNGDGRLDIAVASPNDGRIRLHAVAPDGSFFVAASIAVGGRPASIFAGDFDRDGQVDLAWADELSGDVGVLLLTPGFPVGAELLRRSGPDEATSVVMLDSDFDGWLELRSAHGGADALMACPNLDGTLGDGVIENVGDRPDRLLLLNHAGGPTLAVRQSGRLSGNFQLTNLASGARQQLALAGGGEAFAVDFDGDGEDEFVASDEESLELVVYAHVGDGWQESWRFPVDGGITGIAVANADPLTRRLAVASEERRRLTLYRIEGAQVIRERAWYAGSDLGFTIYDDLDRDGTPEVILANSGLNRMQILPPLGSGLLGAEAATTPRGAVHLTRGTNASGAILFAVSASGAGQVGVYTVSDAALGEPLVLDAAPGVRAARFGQLDQVADVDLVSVSRTGGVRTHLSDGAGGYVSSFGFIPAAQITDLALVDVMGSPALDLILASQSPPALIVHEGLGDGSFVTTPAAVIATTEPLVVVRGYDLDLDGRKDIVALGFDSLLMIFQNRAGEALASVDLLVQNAPRDVGIGRFNLDNLPDLITVNEAGSDFTVVTSLLPGVYSVAVRGTPTLPGARRLEVADLNRDGADDFCVIASATRTVGVHLNLGTATEPSTRFSAPIQYELIESATDFSIADLDGDGWLDLVGVDGVADVLVSRLHDPFAQVSLTSAQIQVEAAGQGRLIRVFSTAEFAHDLRLLRQPGNVVLALGWAAPGVFTALDAHPPAEPVDYVVVDRRGAELDRFAVGLGPGATTDAPSTGPPTLLPVSYQPGRAVLRMRAAPGVIPQVRIFDLRGRRVAELEVTGDSGGWYEAAWTGTDFRGRPVSRGRYLVRALLGPVTGTGSIHLH